MVVAYASGSSTTVMAASFTPFYHFPMKIPASVELAAFNDLYSASSKATKITARGEAQQPKEEMADKPHTLVASVYYRPTVDEEEQI